MAGLCWLPAPDHANKVYLNKWGTGTTYDYTTDSNVRIVLISSDGSNLSAITRNRIYFLNPNYYKNNVIINISNISLASMSSDGSYVAAGSENAIYLIHKNGTLLWEYDTNYLITDVRISSDGSRIAAGAGSNIYVFNKGGALLWSYRTGKDVTGVSISSNGSYVAAGAKDNRVYFIGEKKPLSFSIAAPTIPEVSGAKTSTYIAAQIPEPVHAKIPAQNESGGSRSTPFESAIYVISFLFAVWMLTGTRK